MQRILSFKNLRTKTFHQVPIQNYMLSKNVLQIAHENKIDLEGACEGSLACSTCHIIVEPENFQEPSEEEQDMLDLAIGLQDTSRLGCQLIVSDLLKTSNSHEIMITIPSQTRNLSVDGYLPKPH
jgi:ferredoxin